MTKSVEQYFTEGCGRCSLGGTPQCKVHKWADIMAFLRRIMLDCGLTETCKWGVPCYTDKGKNILVIGASKDNCSIGFFKGALLSNFDGKLAKPGDDSQAARQLKYTSLSEVVADEDHIKAHVFEAIEIEQSGKKIVFAAIDETAFPEELLDAFKKDKRLEAVFRALTPGRQKGYIIHFKQPKQSATRVSRIEKAKPMILQGKGMNDEYRDRIKK